MDYLHIDTLEVARKFGYLIADKGHFSGLEFAKKILASGSDCETHREACASSVASTLYDIELMSNSKCKIQELL